MPTISAQQSSPRATRFRTRGCSPTASPWAVRCGVTWSLDSPRRSRQLGLGFSQLAALYAADGVETLTIADLAEQIGRSPSATSRLVAALEARGLLKRNEEVADRRQRTLEVTAEGKSVLAEIDTARAAQFLSVVRPLPPGERALVAMGVAALSTRAITRRGRLIKER